MDYMVDLIFSEAVKEIGKNIGKAVSDFVGFAFTFIGDQIKGFFGLFQSKSEVSPIAV